LIAVLIAAFAQLKVGKELADDPEYQRRLRAGEITPPTVPAVSPSGVANAGTPPAKQLKRGARTSVLIFFTGIALVVLAGIFPLLRTIPGTSAKPAVIIGMPIVIAIVMLAVAAMILSITGAPAAEVPKSKTCQSGVTALIGILGLAWLGDTFISANQDTIIGALSNMAKAAPWTFAIGLFVASMLLYSQAATARALMPLGLSLGIPAAALIGMFPAVNGYFFIPNYGTLIAAMQFDRSGTTRIGKYLLNHSFMLPGLITTAGGVAIGLVIAKLFFRS
jgi:anaerobic C4-dicarboxylate transporter DcuA